MLPEFNIDPAYLTDVPMVRTWSKFDTRTELTDDEIIESLKGEGQYTMRWAEDHPKFAELRTQLALNRFIRVSQTSVNGDQVLKKFKLNGYLFKPNESFPCAAAMNIKLKVDASFRRK